MKIDKINTEIERVEPGNYVFNHDMVRITKIAFNFDKETWQITTPGEHVLGDLNHQKMVEILMGHCGFESDTSRVISAALTIELSERAQLGRRLADAQNETAQYAARANQAADEKAQLAGKVTEAERIAQELRNQLTELAKRTEWLELERAQLANKLEEAKAEKEELANNSIRLKRVENGPYSESDVVVIEEPKQEEGDDADQREDEVS